MKLTYTQEADFRQERPFGAKINATFEFIGAHFRPLGTAILYIVLPVMLVGSIALGAVQTGIFGAALDGAGRGNRAAGSSFDEIFGANALQYFTGGTLVAVVALVSAYVLLSATVYGYVRLCMEGVPQPIAPGQVWERVRALLPTMLLYMVGLVGVFILAAMLFFIPALYLSVPLTLFFAVYVMEGQAFGATFSRCLALIKNNWWATFGLIIVVSFIEGFMAMVFQVPLMVVMMSKAMHWGFMGSSTMLLIMQSLATVGQSLLRVILLLALCFQYFHLVELKDGLGLRHLVNQLGQAPAEVRNETYRADEEGEY